MARSGSKYKFQDIIPLQNIIDSINSSSGDVLLEVGRAVAPQEYAIRFYKDRSQPRFYNNIERLRYTVLKAITVSSFNHWEQVLNILYKNHVLDLDEEQEIFLNEKLYGIANEDRDFQ
ncbi:MAG: hypothetical protein GX895_02645 [Clostridiales bacterium]|uniref:hypothetical protein n=1 Tax=Clostridium sp. N3C TaxID=1776758 RepID=UPI00094296E7|nr:hypothetical protein [Clostridium sp. N3C]NLZ47682.1 hypothetical protein [Clostridiales bacterium]